MKIRHSMELLLNLGNYSNIKLISDVSMDTESEGDVAFAKSVAAEIGQDEPVTVQDFDKLTLTMCINSLEEQKKALDEVDAELFDKPKSAPGR